MSNMEADNVKTTIPMSFSCTDALLTVLACVHQCCVKYNENVLIHCNRALTTELKPSTNDSPSSKQILYYVKKQRKN